MQFSAQIYDHCLEFTYARLGTGRSAAIIRIPLQYRQTHRIMVSSTSGGNVSLLIAALGKLGVNRFLYGVRFLYLAAVNLQSNGLERRG